MKRILLLIFLLVNLQLIMQDGDLRVSLASISAQSYMYEELPEVEVIGNLRDCPWGCGTRLCKTEMDVHEQNCDLRMVECPSCHQKDTKSRIDNGWHQCGSSSNNEGSNTGGGGGGHSGGGVGHVGGGGNFGGWGQNLDGFKRKIPVSELKYKSGVKLVSYTKIPDKLHPQTRKMDCVLKAYAFMAELKGYNYDNACEVMDRIAKSKYFDLEKKGIPSKELLVFFQDYCQIDTDYNKPWNVSFYVDQGIPVAIITCSSPYHMVTVIGYDNKYYYTAAGDGNGDVAVFSKSELDCGSLYIFNSTNTPYK